MGLTPGLVLGALGGPHTFGAQAARLLMQRYPEFEEIRFFPTSDEALDAVKAGEVAATCAPEQMAKTGYHLGMMGRVAPAGADMHVAAEITHVYHASLLVKPGTKLEQIKRVLGHTGSVTQSRKWLEENLQGASVEIVDTSSFGAGSTVLEGDGSIASVGTPELARDLGLEELAKEIDEGSVANYWAISNEPFYTDNPDRLVVAVRLGGDGTLTDLIGALASAGYRLQTVYSQASGQALFEHDYVLRFSGTGTLEVVKGMLAPFRSARLAGAFDSRQ